MDKLKEELIRDEGIEYKIYHDDSGFKCFGIAHSILPTDEEYGQLVETPVSKERVDTVFEQDVQIRISECRSLFPQLDTYPNDVWRVLVNMTFHLGKARFSKFDKFIAAIKMGDFVKAAVEGRNSTWYGEVHERAERLMKVLEEATQAQAQLPEGDKQATQTQAQPPEGGKP